MEQITLDPERQKKAKEYARIHRRLFVVELAWSGLYALLWLVAGWAVGLKAALLGLHANLWLVIAAFAVIYAGIDMLLSLPLSYYSEFVLPHRYELSNETLKGWIADNLKALLIFAPIGLILIEVIYAVLRRFPNTWWLWAAGFMLLFTVLLANLSPLLIAPIFNKYIPLGEEHQDLAERLLRLAERAHTRVRGVYKFDLSRRTKTANAALTGIGNSRRIILGDTLIEEFTPDEIETVLAHELGHHVNRDIPLIILVGSVSTLVGFYLASLGLKWGVHFWGFEDASDISALPLFILVIGVYSLVTMPLNNAFSRWRERLADQYALQATGNGEAFASAMRRLANQNLADADPEPWVEFLLYSHPALRKRIAMAETFSTS
ncbi:MAG: M48 family metallopeptidase [Anaerolineales bacterium]|nr:M48 family metallopeptidase [Anaerolineales bacterium]